MSCLPKRLLLLREREKLRRRHQLRQDSPPDLQTNNPCISIIIYYHYLLLLLSCSKYLFCMLYLYSVDIYFTFLLINNNPCIEIGNYHHVLCPRVSSVHPHCAVRCLVNGICVWKSRKSELPLCGVQLIRYMPRNYARFLLGNITNVNAKKVWILILLPGALPSPRPGHHQHSRRPVDRQSGPQLQVLRVRMWCQDEAP